MAACKFLQKRDQIHSFVHVFLMLSGVKGHAWFGVGDEAIVDGKLGNKGWQ